MGITRSTGRWLGVGVGSLFVCALVAYFAISFFRGDKPTQEPQMTSTEAAVQEGDTVALIFGTPVPVSNYLFARRIHQTFQTPEEKEMSDTEWENNLWRNLIYSYLSFQRKIEVTSEEMDQWIDSVLRALGLPFTRTENPNKYREWITDTLQQDVELFENQMRYLAEIEMFKRNVVSDMQVEVAEEEIQMEYLDVQNHVGGEYTLFDTKQEADVFFNQYRDETKWAALKGEFEDLIKPFSTMTLQAIMDLWGVPRDVMYEFHGLSLGSVGRPMPFGKRWGVFRLLDKREGNAAEMGERRETNLERVRIKKQYRARDQWLEDVIQQANLKILMTPEDVKRITVER